MNLVMASLDNSQLKLLMDYYHTSGLYNKIFGTAMYGPIANI